VISKDRNWFGVNTLAASHKLQGMAAKSDMQQDIPMAFSCSCRDDIHHVPCGPERYMFLDKLHRARSLFSVFGFTIATFILA
jgi:hypothetical protein